MTDQVIEAILESTLDVKDVFLDDPETYIAGAEDDPEIKKLLDSIPEYSEDDDTKQEIEAATESLTATQVHDAPSSASDVRAEITRLELENRRMLTEAALYRKRGNTFQLQHVTKRLRANDERIKALRVKLRTL